MTKTLADRFWEKVDKTGECWNWLGCRCHGYGYIKAGEKLKRAHRVVWEMTFSEIPPGAYVCHRCDNPSCVRPSHLFLGTALSNMKDKMVKGRFRNGAATPWCQPRGDEHANSKLSDVVVARMRRKYSAGGVTLAQLIEHEGIAVSIAAVHKALSGKTWRHV